ncbi:MAG: hypothetical protein HW407_1024 [Bacteroidetes bacterium]|nr:hypothetical protein [Bacteroidota bacterium]
MNCKHFQEQISGAVDKNLLRDEMDSFHGHIGKCPQCRYEYEIESVTKAIVQRRAKVVRAPDALVQQISEQLERETATFSATPPNRFSSFLQKAYAKPTIAFAVACIAVVLLLNDQRGKEGTLQAGFAANDIVSQSLSNYRAVVAGEIKPQMMSSQIEPLAQFFSDKTDFPVLFPKMKDCKLVGGVFNEYFGSKLAHVVYSHDSEVVYMYQTCWETVMKGEPLHLSDDVKQALETTGWFSQTHDDGRTVVLWKKERTLCAAVARMSKEDLIACLTEDDADGKPAW